jgi:hypothetical protein
MRLVKERSLSSILRSNLLTTLINNDVSGKVNASGCASASDNFGAAADVISGWMGGEKGCA